MTNNLTPLQRRILLGRGIVGVVLTSLAIILLAAGIVGIGVIYQNPLISDNSDCALKSGFGLFLVAAFIEVLLLILECISLCTMNIQAQCCKCEHYHCRFILHFTSATMVIIGAIIYGVEDKGRIGWSFWVVFSASVLSLINGVLWCMTMQMRRFLIKGGSGTAKDTGFGAPIGGITGLGGDVGLGAPFGGDVGLGNIGGTALMDDLGGLDNSLGGDLGGISIGTELGNIGLDSNLTDVNLSTQLDNLPSGDIQSVGLESDPVLQQELLSAPLEDPILLNELKSAPMSDSVLVDELKSAPVCNPFLAELNSTIEKNSSQHGIIDDDKGLPQLLDVGSDQELQRTESPSVNNSIDVLELGHTTEVSGFDAVLQLI